MCKWSVNSTILLRGSFKFRDERDRSLVKGELIEYVGGVLHGHMRHLHSGQKFNYSPSPRAILCESLAPCVRAPIRFNYSEDATRPCKAVGTEGVISCERMRLVRLRCPRHGSHLKIFIKNHLMPVENVKYSGTM